MFLFWTQIPWGNDPIWRSDFFRWGWFNHQLGIFFEVLGCFGGTTDTISCMIWIQAPSYGPKSWSFFSSSTSGKVFIPSVAGFQLSTAHGIHDFTCLFLAFPWSCFNVPPFPVGFCWCFFWQFRVGYFFPHGLTGQNVTDRIRGGGFRYVLFSPLFWEDFEFD